MRTGVNSCSQLVFASFNHSLPLAHVPPSGRTFKYRTVVGDHTTDLVLQHLASMQYILSGINILMVMYASY